MVIEVNNVNKSFGAKKVLRGISFKAEGGKAFGLLGRNGAGKTTTIRIIMNVFRPDSGEVLLDGDPIERFGARIGYLPEERGLYPKKVIIEQLVYFAMLNGMEKKDAVSSCDKWLGRLGMSEYRDKKLETLSKGNQQKIQLITAVAHDPRIVILDEPFSGLDPVNALLLKDVVRELISSGKIVLFSSHQMNYIEEFCDDIAIIRNGEIALCGPLDGIKRSYPRDRLVIRSKDYERIAYEFRGTTTLGKSGEVMLTLPSPEDKNTVMKNVTEKYDVDEIKVFEPTLNDIFVEYAGGKRGENE